MKAFFDQLISPQTGLPQNEFEYVRQRIIGVSLLVIAIILTGLFGTLLFEAIRNQAWSWAVIYTVGLGLILLITFSKQVPYAIRAGTVLLVFYALGLNSAVDTGTTGVAGLLFILFSLSVVIFINMSTGVISVILSVVTLLLVAYGLRSGWFPYGHLATSTNPEFIYTWWKTSAMVFAVGISAVISFGTLLQALQKSLFARDHARNELIHHQESFERRTKDIQRRENQVQIAAEISRTISAELNQDQLLNQVVNLVKERFDLYYVGVFLLDNSGAYAILQSGTGEAGQEMLRVGHKLPVSSTSMIGWAVSRRQARIALDVGQDAVRFDNPYLPETRSELAIPMIFGHQVIGAMTVQSEKPSAFDSQDILVLQGVADSLAIAIQNARLFQQAEANLREIRTLHKQYLGEVWSDMLATKGELRYTYENPIHVASSESQPATLEKQISIRDQEIGKLTIETDQQSWNPEDEAFIDAVISQAAIALENVRLVETTQLASQHDRVLADISSRAWASPDVDHILKTTLSELVQSLSASHGTIILEPPPSKMKD
jgi:GAF domain-containing protein